MRRGKYIFAMAKLNEMKERNDEIWCRPHVSPRSASVQSLAEFFDDARHYDWGCLCYGDDGD